MNIKFYQSIDTIHGTIFYTNLEKMIISTPYFNRLHDVNQSSTVYLTFPPNRTKRYEHSLGVMQITSDLFCSAASNSASGTCDSNTSKNRNALEYLMKCTKTEFKKITEHIKNKQPFFLSDNRQDNIEDILNTLSINLMANDDDYLEKTINNNFASIFEDNYLFNLVPKSLSDGYETFLFMALLQALRIVSLLHDIGHPPQSHILEEVLQEISDELDSQKPLTKRQEEFVNIMAKYKTNTGYDLEVFDKNMAIKAKGRQEAHLHEKIGLYIIKYIITDVFPKMINNKTCADIQTCITNAVYYITVSEFVFAVLRDKTMFWEGMHSIIDGTIDTDRMDCVARDSRNSGMPWGQIEFSRLIKTAKLGIIGNEPTQKKFRSKPSSQKDEITEENVQICFSAKEVPQMDDILLNRYKIFSMINYHHRSTKIAALYKKAVKLLALEYLCSSENPTRNTKAFSDISGLWRALGIEYSQKGTLMNIIQWNDSWMNGILYNHLVEMIGKKNRSPKQQEILECLEEIFMNENNYTSLIKRKSEIMEINTAAQHAMAQIKTKLNDQLKSLQKEQEDKETDDTKREKNILLINWISVVIDAITDNDWSKLESKLGFQIKDKIDLVLSKHEPTIDSWFVQKVKFSLGLDKVVYVYDYSGKPVKYNAYTNVDSIIKQSRTTFPYYYVYIKSKNEFSDQEKAELRKEIGKCLGRSVTNGVNKYISLTPGRKNKDNK